MQLLNNCCNYLFYNYSIKMINHLKSIKIYYRIMEITSKNANIYACCVLNESRLNELKGLSEELDRR